MANQARQLLERLRAQVGGGPDPDVPIVDAQGAVAPAPGPTLAQRMLAAARGAEPAGTTSQAIVAGTGEQMLGNLTGLPQGLLNIANPAANKVRGLLGQPDRPPPDLGLPTGRDMASGIESVGLLGRSMLPGGPQVESIGEAFQQRQDFRGQMQQDRPGAFGAGEFLGDAATIAMGRAPSIRGPGGLFDKPIQEGLERAARSVNPGSMTTGTRRQIEKILNNDSFQGLARGAGRAGETGLEAAILTTMQSGDPLEVGALAAGAQLGTSAILTGVSETARPFKALPKTMQGLVAGVTASALLYGGLAQMAKSVAPGGDNYILESSEFGFSKVAFNIALGATLGLAGKRSKPGGILDAYPMIADAMTTIPRTAMIKLIQSGQDDPEIGQTLEAVAANPGAFTVKEMQRLNDAVRNQDDPAAALRKLLEDEGFRQKISAPDPRLIGVPVKEED